MNNVYRLGEEQCHHCFELGQRVHELEQHDMDFGDLQRYAWNFFTKMLWIGIWLALIGGGSALGGLWLYETVSGNYGLVLATTTWVFGTYIFVNSILIASRYHNEKGELINRLGKLRYYRSEQIKELQAQRRERKKKEREANG